VIDFAATPNFVNSPLIDNHLGSVAATREMSTVRESGRASFDRAGASRSERGGRTRAASQLPDSRVDQPSRALAWPVAADSSGTSSTI
jgi:hypothetical protein